MRRLMDKISYVMNSLLWGQVKTGFAVLMVLTAVIIILSVIFSAREFKKAGRTDDAQEPAADNGGVSDSDNTD
ncbi:MAG: hypothetical protein IKS39_08425 [Clostridia bacterium]|nr:hypothetical protein [Clostridia bacterium]